MLHKKIVSFVGCLLLLTPIALADEAERAAQIDEIFAAFGKPGSPGAAIAVIHDGEIVFESGYGLANLELEVPITPQSVFYLGSVSKQFVAASIALLELDGKLSLDDDVRKYVPELPDYGTPITVRHLVHHTSGLRDYLGLMTLAGIPLGTFHDNQRVVELIARQKNLNFDPGTQYLYSNSGYFLLAVIVEKASGQSLREYAAEKIFGPLGMKQTHFHDDYMHLIPNRASGYFPGSDGGYRHFLSTFDRVGSGGMFSSVGDLYLWDQNFYDPKVGGEAFVAKLHEQGRLANGEELDYAFGLVVREHKGLRVVEHGGALGGYRSTLVRFPDQRFSIAVLANVSSAQPGNLAMQVADLYLAEQYAELETAPADTEKATPKTVEVSREELDRLTGSYWNEEGKYSRRIYVKGQSTLMYARSLVSESALAPLGKDRFRMLGVGVFVEVTFEGFKDGKAGRMIVEVEGDVPAVSEAYEPISVSAEYLEAFAGTYHSDELMADYEVSVNGLALIAAGPDGEPARLMPVIADVFNTSGAAVSFTRDKDRRVDGFVLDAGRVKGLRFERR